MCLREFLFKNDIYIYPVFSFDDTVSNLHPMGFRRFLSLFQVRFLFQDFQLLNNIVCELTSTIIHRRIPVEVARLSLNVGHGQIARR